MSALQQAVQKQTAELAAAQASIARLEHQQRHQQQPSEVERPRRNPDNAVLSFITGAATAGRDLLVAENNLKPWPSGHGEDPPPLGSLVQVNATSGWRHVVATNIVDPVWLASDGRSAYVGLFHSGEIVRIALHDGSSVTVAKGLSCPEGVALDQRGFLYVVENPVGNECRQPIRKPAAQLTKIDLRSGLQTKVAGLRSSTGGDEGGPHGLAIEGDNAYVCECPAGAAALTQVNLQSGAKTQIAPLNSPSGCAVGGGYAFVVEQGRSGQLVQVELRTGDKTILLDRLKGPMGVALDLTRPCPKPDGLCGSVYVAPRMMNEVIKYHLELGKWDVFAGSDAVPFNSPIGLAMV